MFLAIFDLQVTLMLPTKFQVNWPFRSGEEAKDRLSRWPSWQEAKDRLSRWPSWQPSWISNRKDFSYFDLQVTLLLPTKFPGNWPFFSGEKVNNRFSRWLPWRPSWTSNQNDFSYFLFACHPDASYQVSSQLAQGLLKQLLTLHDARRTMHNGH